MDTKKIVGLLVTLVITIFLWAVPTDFYGIEALTVVQQRVIAMFVMAALLWIFEPIPNWTTSVLVIVLVATVASGILCLQSVFVRNVSYPLVTDQPGIFHTVRSWFQLLI